MLHVAGGDYVLRESLRKAPRKRTKTGCLTCRQRRIKCGEEKPTCFNCIKSKRVCEGYSQRVVFKDDMNGAQQEAGAQNTSSSASSSAKRFSPYARLTPQATRNDPPQDASLRLELFHDGSNTQEDSPRVSDGTVWVNSFQNRGPSSSRPYGPKTTPTYANLDPALWSQELQAGANRTRTMERGRDANDTQVLMSVS